jgi:regulator of sirC expression with transglutaminase-like and TPR domain
VLLLRRGIPISLAGVFSLCCSAVGLRQPLMATNLPFHFLLAVRLR